MADTFSFKWGETMCVPFVGTNVAASGTNTALTVPSSGSSVSMIHAGYVVGMSVDANTAFTSGSVGFYAAVNGTAYAQGGITSYVALGPDGDELISDYFETRPGVLKFDAGDDLSILYTSSSDLVPNGSTDVQAQLYFTYTDS